MASHDDLVDGEPPAIDPYETLGITSSATPDQVKSAYRKAALKNHPDKVEADKKAEAHDKFQAIAFAYAVLSDPARRKRYDETGSTAESIVDAEGFSWTDYYKALYRDAVSEDAIRKFAETYKGSEEERGDILAAYEASEGDMDGVYEAVMLSSVLEDDARIRGVIDELIAAGRTRSFPAYARENRKSRRARLNRAKEEAREAEEYAKELGVHGKLFGDGDGRKKARAKKDAEADLAALIKRNSQKHASSLIEELERKYVNQPKSKAKAGKKRKADEAEVVGDDEHDIPEDQFQAIQAGLLKKKGKVKK